MELEIIHEETAIGTIQRYGALSSPARFEGWKLRKWSMRLSLIPIRNGSHIIGERLIRPVGPPSQSLYRCTKIALETHRIHNVPAVQAP